MSRWLLPTLALTLAATTFAPTPAHAQDPQQQAMGRALFDEATALMKDNRFAEACPKLEASLKAYPGIGTRGKLAECYEKQGKYASAWAAWREVAQLATRAGEVTREQFASERAKSLEPKLAYVTVNVPSASDLPGLVIKRNGREVERSKIGAADPVDPGIVSFEVSAPGRKTVTGQIAVAQAQAKTFDVPLLEPEKPAEKPATPPPVVAEFPKPQDDGGSWQKPVGIVALGVGLAGIGVGSFFGIKAKSTYDEPFDGNLCDKTTKDCTPDGQSKVDDARKQATISTIGFAAGGALLVGGLILLVTAPSKASAVRFIPTVTADGGGMTIAGSL